MKVGIIGGLAAVLLIGVAGLTVVASEDAGVPGQAANVDGPATGVARAQSVKTSNAKALRVLSSALEEPVPDVVIDQVVDGPVEITGIAVADDNGEFTTTDAAELEVVGTAVIVHGDRRKRAQADDTAGITSLLCRGDILVKGAIRNVGQREVWLALGGDRDVVLAPDLAMYVGSASSLELTHKKICRCLCFVSVRESCTADLAGVTEDCGSHTGEACTCGGTNEGELQNCHDTWVPEVAPDEGAGA